MSPLRRIGWSLSTSRVSSSASVLTQSGHRNRHPKRGHRATEPVLAGVGRGRARSFTLTLRGPEHVSLHARRRTGTGRGDIFNPTLCPLLRGVVEVHTLGKDLCPGIGNKEQASGELCRGEEIGRA